MGERYTFDSEMRTESWMTRVLLTQPDASIENASLYWSDIIIHFLVLRTDIFRGATKLGVEQKQSAMVYVWKPEQLL